MTLSSSNSNKNAPTDSILCIVVISQTWLLQSPTILLTSTILPVIVNVIYVHTYAYVVTLTYVKSGCSSESACDSPLFLARETSACHGLDFCNDHHPYRLSHVPFLTMFSATVSMKISTIVAVALTILFIMSLFLSLLFSLSMSILIHVYVFLTSQFLIFFTGYWKFCFKLMRFNLWNKC